jgi:hypothetical protein
MKRGMPAFLRNQLFGLSVLDGDKSGVRVRLGSQDLGIWESLLPRFWRAGNRINLQLTILGRRRAYSLIAVRKIAGGVKLQLSRPGRAVPECLEVRWMENEADDFLPHFDARLLLHTWLRSQFPGCQVVSCKQRADLAKSLSGSFVRANFRYCGKNFLALAGDKVDCGREAYLCLTQALIWLCHLQRDKLFARVAPTIHILTSSDCSAVLCHRAMHLNPKRVKVQVWEWESGAPQSGTTRKAPQPSPPMEHRDYRWPALGPFHWSPLLLRVFDLAPLSIRRYPRFQEYDSLRLSGLEFAWAFGPTRERVCFGVGPQKKELTDESYPELTALVDEILFYRRPDSPDPWHAYYRAQPERWLESLILDEASNLFPELAPGCVYSQIPVYLGKEPGRVDVLGADERGSLVVMELKVNPDPDLPMQALDYWARVLRHNRNGDFERRGYFPGICLLRSYPKIYLVSPIFSYHDTTEQILRFVDPKVEVWKISVNEDWRCGVKVLRRTRIIGGKLSSSIPKGTAGNADGL